MARSSRGRRRDRSSEWSFPRPLRTRRPEPASKDDGTRRDSARRGWDLLGGLLSPLRLPERVLVAIESIAERLEDVRPMREEVETIRRQSADLDQMLPALTSMKEDLGGRLDSLHELIVELAGIEAGLDKRVGELCREIAAMHRTVGGLKGDVERVTERLPDANEAGPLERARDVLTGVRADLRVESDTGSGAATRGPTATARSAQMEAELSASFHSAGSSR